MCISALCTMLLSVHHLRIRQRVEGIEWRGAFERLEGSSALHDIAPHMPQYPEEGQEGDITDFWPRLGAVGCVVLLWAGQVVLCNIGFNRDCQLKALSSRAALQNLEILILYTVLLISVSGISAARVRYFQHGRWYFWCCLVIVGPLFSALGQIQSSSKAFQSVFHSSLLNSAPLIVLVLLTAVGVIGWHFWYGFCHRREDFEEYAVLRILIIMVCPMDMRADMPVGLSVDICAERLVKQCGYMPAGMCMYAAIGCTQLLIMAV